jgi:hypothetical protein
MRCTRTACGGISDVLRGGGHFVVVVVVVVALLLSLDRWWLGENKKSPKKFRV